MKKTAIESAVYSTLIATTGLCLFAFPSVVLGKRKQNFSHLTEISELRTRHSHSVSLGTSVSTREYPLQMGSKKGWTVTITLGQNKGILKTCDCR
jgi:hypothetical protein